MPWGAGVNYRFGEPCQEHDSSWPPMAATASKREEHFRTDLSGNAVAIATATHTASGGHERLPQSRGV